MWSHYADNHKGFCIEYDVSNFPFKEFENINYREDYHYITNLKFFTKREAADKADRIPSFQKSSYWSYEKEVRLFKLNGSGLEKYDKSAVAGIYFGCRADDSDFEIIKAILNNKKTYPNLFLAHQSDDGYKLVFKQIS